MENITELPTKRTRQRRCVIKPADLYCLQEYTVKSRTLQSVADDFGVSRERIRQRVAKFPVEIREYPAVAASYLADKRVPVSVGYLVPAPAPYREPDGGE